MIERKNDKQYRFIVALAIPAALALITSAVSTIASRGLPAQAASKQPMVKVGDKAPPFKLPNQDGKMVALKDFEGKSPVVLYFYPKDDTLICKKEACLFRDHYPDFAKAGAVVIGVSSDSIKSHKRFVDRRNLPFTLLSDKNGSVRKLYGIPKTAYGALPGRVTFVIDRDGIVRSTYDSLLHVEKHVDETLKVVRQLSESSRAKRRQRLRSKERACHS